jgi:hypothetical protein
MSYVCRTSHKTKVKATDFVVGTNLTYQLDEHKGKLKNASNEQVKCTVVRRRKTASHSNGSSCQELIEEGRGAN